ncbi:MAG: hypothetical protein H0T84_06760 [Tatlockia sp.]|nr:hypothetical protein [Tatlockia sp.]
MIFSIYVTVKYRNTEQYKKTRLNVFFSTLASVAIIFVGINILLSSLSFESSQSISRQNKTKEAVDRFWLYPNRLLESSTHIRRLFRASFFLNNPEVYNMARAKEDLPLTIDTIAQEQFISNVIIQAWEDSLTIRDYDETPIKYWLRTFITWAQSPYLKSYYHVSKQGYKESTRTLAELLFEYAEKIPVPVENTNIYITTVDKLMKDARYLALMQFLANPALVKH